MRKTLITFIVLVVACFGVFANASQPPKFFCDKSRSVFQERHAAAISFENNDPMTRMWKNDVSVIVQAPIGANGALQWVEVAQLRFWMNTTYNEEGCFWDERQFWERRDPATGALVEIGCQRIDLLINGPSTGLDFITADGDGKGFEERASKYDVLWFKNRYLAESVSVVDTTLIEYALGDGVVAGGWYNQNNEVIFQNAIITFVPGESRTYTYSTIERQQGLTFKVLASIESNNVEPTQDILDASAFFEGAINDPNFVPRLNPETGFEEYIYSINQNQQRQVKDCLNTKCEMHGFSFNKYVENLIQKHNLQANN
jgi:hypothetical protein